MFYTVVYRNPAINFSSPVFSSVLASFEYLFATILSENPCTMLFAGDFNAQGTALDSLVSSLNLPQLMVESTNFQDNCNSSCIDLSFCDPPNLIMQSGTHPALDTHCKHRITFCRLNSSSASIQA